MLLGFDIGGWVFQILKDLLRNILPYSVIEGFVLFHIQSAIPFWPENDTKRLKIKVEGCLLPPQTIDFTRPENCLLLHLDNSVSRHTHKDKCCPFM